MDAIVATDLHTAPRHFAATAVVLPQMYRQTHQKEKHGRTTPAHVNQELQFIVPTLTVLSRGFASFTRVRGGLPIAVNAFVAHRSFVPKPTHGVGVPVGGVGVGHFVVAQGKRTIRGVGGGATGVYQSSFKPIPPIPPIPPSRCSRCSRRCSRRCSELQPPSYTVGKLLRVAFGTGLRGVLFFGGFVGRGPAVKLKKMLVIDPTRHCIQT
jgi:hypothetical protein